MVSDVDKLSVLVVVSVVFGAGLVLVPLAAGAENSSVLRSRINQFTEILDKHTGNSLPTSARKTRDRARQWLEDAQVLLAEENSQRAKQLVRRVEFSVELIEAQLKANRLEKEAATQEESHYRLVHREIPDLKSELKSLKEEWNELQQAEKVLKSTAEETN